MLKMMIVDDEEIERNALKLLIERFAPHIDIVGEAGNGRCAVELAQELKPDLIIMDIKMPGIDGIEAIRIIHEKMPGMQYIMLSAFDEFEYARTVMRYGVKEYLLKPCRKEQFLEAVRRAEAEIAVKRQQQGERDLLENRIVAAQMKMESELVASLLMNYTRDIEQTTEEKMLSQIIQYGAYVIVLSFSAGVDLTHELRLRLQRWTREEIKELSTCLAGPMTGHHIPVIIIPNREDREQLSIRSQAVKLAGTLIMKFGRQYEQIKMSIGIGNYYEREQELARSYHESLIAAKYKRAAKLTLFEDVSILMQGQSHPFPHEKERELLRLVKYGHTEQAEALFDCYLEELFVYSRFELSMIKHELNKLFGTIVQIGTDSGLSLDAGHSFDTLQDEQTIRQHARFQLHAILNDLSNWYLQEHNGNLQRAKQYIDDHYNYELSLEEVAEHVQLNPFYFSKLFHDRCGVTFIDYVTNRRIGAAKELLADPKQPLKDISLQVGYRDPNYFSRVFKKSTTMSPSEYRNSIIQLAP